MKQQLEKLRREEKQASKELQDFLVNAELLDFSAKVIIENTQRGNGKLSDVRTQISATEAEITKLHRAAALEEDKVKQYALALASQPGDALSQRQDEHSSPKTTGRLRTLKSELEVLRSQENEIDKGLKELVQASLVIAVSDEMILGDTKALADIRAKIAATEAEIGNPKQGEAR